MNNFKYSLKTQQFGKKRYQIFPKETEKESISLEVIEPNHNVSHLLELNKSEEQSAIMYSKQNYTDIENQQKQLQQQIQTVKLPQQLPLNKINQLQKPKNINHSIQTTQKIKIPQCRHDYDQNLSQSSQRQQMKQFLQTIQYTLLTNEERLNKLVDSINSLYRNTIDLYNNHQRKLKQLVNQRCCDIVRIFRFTLAEIDKKEQIVEHLDDKIMVLLNTIKDSKESLRITKIKQECIEALQREQQSLLEKERKQKLNQLSSAKQHKFINESTHAVAQMIKPKSLKEQKPQNINYSIDFSLKNQAQPRRLVSKQFSMITCNEEQYEFVESFISSPAMRDHLQQKSPFQANDLYYISSTVPIMNIGEPISINQKQTEYSFRKAIPSKMSHSSNKNNGYSRQNAEKKMFSSKRTDNLTKLQSALSQLKQGDLSKEVWVDNLNCLRRRNGTYILDQSGNALICSQEDLQRLLANYMI